MASSKPAIYTALSANLLIAITKFIAAALTGSSAMVSEGIHSFVDTSNEVLLLLGISKSNKKADEKRPFGYGKEIYFWSFIVSILIFGVGAGISFYEGITHLRNPKLVENPIWNYIVLGFAFLFDGISFTIALKNFNKKRHEQPFWIAVERSKDPASFVVLFEDAADILGLTVAFLGVFFGHYFRNPYFDGIASILIGCILTAVSLVLTKESRSLLMGETISSEILDHVKKITELNSMIEKVDQQLSMVLSPNEALLVLKVKVKLNFSTQEITQMFGKIKNDIRNQYPHVKQIFIEPQQ